MNNRRESITGLRVLIVDDEPLARERIRDLVGEHPEFEVIGECENGIQTISAINDLSPDLVFLDIQIPDLNGFEVVEKIGLKNMPDVIVITAYKKYALRAQELYSFHFILKPFTPGHFHEVLGRVKEKIEKRNNQCHRVSDN
ncbi:response regulator [candidate division KSB1 bacterium]|nr:response regulator [candidate division KSB1 bacterium]